MDWHATMGPMVFGGLAAAGFGVLFNVSLRALPWCWASGALALGVRALAVNAGWSLEASSFTAALVLGCAVQLFQIRVGVARNALGVAGCIPMVPGSFAAKTILGMFALTATNPQTANDLLPAIVQNGLRVIFTVGAIGTGLAIPTLILRIRGSH